MNIKTYFFLFLCLLITGNGFAEAKRDFIQAHLIPLQEATISSQFNGKITSIYVKNGDSFKKNKVLVRFDCSILESQLRKSDAVLQKAEDIYESNLEMNEYKSISNVELKISHSELEVAKAEAGIVKTQLKYCRITAPYAGKVVKLLAHTHESGEVGGPLLEIIKTGTPEIRLFVPSNWLKKIIPGVLFTVAVHETEKEYSAVITRVGGRINPVSQTIEVYGKFQQNNPELLPGMSGHVRFTTKKK